MPPHLRPASLALCALILSVSSALAEDATLSARDGSMSVSGRLLSHDGETYRLDTRWGPLTVDASAVDCTGPACPDLKRIAPELRIAIAPWLEERLLMPLLQSYAAGHGLELRQAEGAGLLHLVRGDQRIELQLRLLHHDGMPGSAGIADAQAIIGSPPPGSPSGRLIAHLPLTLVSAADARDGGFEIDQLAEWRAAPGRWPDERHRVTWHVLPGQAMAAHPGLGPVGHAGMKSAADPAALAQALQQDPWGLALWPGPVPAGLKARPLLGSCGMLLDTSDLAAAAGEHPLAMPLHWIDAPGRLLEPARALRNWLAGPEAARSLQGLGLTTALSQPPVSLHDQGPRLFNAMLATDEEISVGQLHAAMSELSEASRLPFTFRLDHQGNLDAGSRSALTDLSNRLGSGSWPEAEILFIGFTTRDGEAQRNEITGMMRAQTVVRALSQAHPDLARGHVLTAMSLGELMPISCDATEAGRVMNSRVEVWIRPGRRFSPDSPASAD